MLSSETAPRPCSGGERSFDLLTLRDENLG